MRANDGPLRLLVVEDDVLVLCMLIEALEERYELLCARSCVGAHACLLAGAPDVLLLDYLLPDGPAASVLDAADRLSVPALVMTGNLAALAELQGRGRPLLAKPFGLSALQRALEQALEASVLV